MTRRTLPMVLVLALASGPVAAAGQSLLSGAGLGTPVDALDARSRALGSVGVGITGPALLPTDPARSTGLIVPTVTFTLQPTTGTVSQGDAETSVEATRFPLIGISYPVSDWGVATLTYGGYLDQRWRVETSGTLNLAGQEVPITDSFESDGGVSVLRLGFGRTLLPGLAVGASAGFYTGSLERTFTRQFDTASVGADVQPFVTGGRWRMTGPTLALGVAWDPGPFLRVAGTAAWSGDLTATPSDGATTTDRSFDLPVELRLGLGASLTSRILFTAGIAWADWSDTGRSLSTGTAVGGALSVGGGLEVGGTSFLGRALPLRVGYRRTELPFRTGSEDPLETAYAFGFGWNLVQAEGIPLAGLDFATERGERTAGSVEERFWRTTISVRVAGF